MKGESKISKWSLCYFCNSMILLKNIFAVFISQNVSYYLTTFEEKISYVKIHELYVMLEMPSSPFFLSLFEQIPYPHLQPNYFVGNHDHKFQKADLKQRNHLTHTSFGNSTLGIEPAKVACSLKVFSTSTSITRLLPQVYNTLPFQSRGMATQVLVLSQAAGKTLQEAGCWLGSRAHAPTTKGCILLSFYTTPHLSGRWKDI